ncbi:hypothetical protein WJX72_001359 [[Myrmecia] bisecta]|uniref:Uncharacterized protein n=1 Tax=[Myrmecia] bisecta TaxID=41462 RepID=A0AAW1Q744_9CHLO
MPGCLQHCLRGQGRLPLQFPAAHPSCYSLPHRGISQRCSRSSSTLLVTAAQQAEQGAAQERVLRYPDGKERRIRYPVLQQQKAQAVEETGWPCNPMTSYAEEWDPERWNSWDTPDLWDQQTAAGRVQRSAPDPQHVEPAPREQQGAGMPISPAEFMRQFASPAYVQAQKQLWASVRGSYEILEGSPWVQSRPVFVLAVQQTGRDSSAAYTLRTRVSRPKAEDELTKVLGRTRPDGSSLLRVEELLDGVVMFESEDDAERFGGLLEADGHCDMLVARCDSHALFRMAGDVRSLVVLLRAGCQLPQPDQLAISLRGKLGLEEAGEQ